jgi:hypothetical protein
LSSPFIADSIGGKRTGCHREQLRIGRDADPRLFDPMKGGLQRFIEQAARRNGSTAGQIPSDTC